MMPHTPKSNTPQQLEQDLIQEREQYDRIEYALEVRSSDIEHWRCIVRAVRAHRGL